MSGGRSGADQPQNAYIYIRVHGHWQRRRAVRKVQAGWRADSGEGSRMQYIHDEKHTFSDLDENYSGIGKLVAEPFGRECREPKKTTEHA